MAERWQVVDLESALLDLGRHLEYPPTPSLAGRVQASLLAPRRPPSIWRRLFATPLRVALVSLAIVVVALAGVLAVSPQARTAVADRLGQRGAPIEQVPRLPSLTVSPSASPLPPNGAGLDLGQPTTLAQARATLPLLVPTEADLGQPDGVYVAPTSLGGTVSLVYGSRAALQPAAETGVSLLVLESRLPRGGFEPAILGKVAGPGTRLEEMSVNGGRGVWLEGAPHEVFLPDPSGQFRPDRVRLAANVLLWEQAGLLVRLEGMLSRDQALQIAASVR